MTTDASTLVALLGRRAVVNAIRRADRRPDPVSAADVGRSAAAALVSRHAPDCTAEAIEVDLTEIARTELRRRFKR